MEINVLCFSVYGNADRYAWAGIAVDDGEEFYFSGLASSELEASLLGLYESLDSLPSPTPIMIRCAERLPNDLGKRFLPRWKHQGFLEEEHQDAIQNLIDRIATKKCLWSKPVLVSALDRKVQQLAKEHFAEGASSPEITAIPSPPETVPSPSPTVVSPSSTTALSSTVMSPSPKKEIENASSPPTPTATPQKEVDNASSLSSPVLTPETHNLEPLKQEITPQPLESSSPASPADNDVKSSAIPQLLFQAQILIYIDAISAGEIGAWSAMLVDRKSQHALLRASGHRHSNLQTNLLQACIASLQSLRSAEFLVEIRSRHPHFIQLGQQWLPQWSQNSWRKRNGEQPADLPFLQELHRILQTITPSWRYIPQESEERGLLDCHHLAQQALNQLNDGGKGQLERRVPNYPLSKLL